MCGHVGIAGNLDRDSMLTFKDLLFIDTLRGSHGTGVALVPWAETSRTKANTKILKSPVPAPVFLANKAVNEHLNTTSHSVVLGHNRAATHGEHVFENTHPFINDGIVGAHNGTIVEHNLKNLPFFKTTDNKYGTDSELVLASIGQEGVEDTVTELVSASGRGAWAFVWYDYTDNTINFLRNDQRPLFYLFSKNEKQLVWASEANMLRAAVVRRAPTEYDLTKIKYLDEDVHTCWAVPSAGEVFDSKKPTVVEIKGKKPLPVSSSTSSQWAGYNGNHVNRNYTVTDRRSSASQSIKPAATFNFVLDAYEITDIQIKDLFKKNNTVACCNCQADIEQQEIEEKSAKPIDAYSIVCSECVREAELASMEETYNRYGLN